jgi:hypothetical protein
MVRQPRNLSREGDLDQLGDLVEEDDGMGFVAIDDHFAVPLPDADSD